MCPQEYIFHTWDNICKWQFYLHLKSAVNAVCTQGCGSKVEENRAEAAESEVLVHGAGGGRARRGREPGGASERRWRLLTSSPFPSAAAPTSHLGPLFPVQVEHNHLVSPTSYMDDLQRSASSSNPLLWWTLKLRGEGTVWEPGGSHPRTTTMSWRPKEERASERK